MEERKHCCPVIGILPLDAILVITPRMLECNVQVRLNILFEYSRLQLRLNIAHCVTMCGKNFLWVELHGNGTALNMQESGSHADTLRECHICRTQFCDNPRNTQCSNATAIDCRTPPNGRYLMTEKPNHAGLQSPLSTTNPTPMQPS